MPPKRVLSVGQCYADHLAVSRAFRGHFEADVQPADTAAEALEHAGQEKFDLILVNRVLDADGSSGLDLIRRLRQDDRLAGTPVMLVSNYDDAQREAAQAGATPGFGKAALGQPPMVARVKAVLG